MAQHRRNSLLQLHADGFLWRSVPDHSLDFWKRCLHVCARLCPTLCCPMDCSPPGSCVYGILRKITGVSCHFLLRGGGGGDLPDPGPESGSPALQADSLLSEPLGKPISLFNSPQFLNLPHEGCPSLLLSSESQPLSVPLCPTLYPSALPISLRLCSLSRVRLCWGRGCISDLLPLNFPP